LGRHRPRRDYAGSLPGLNERLEPRIARRKKLSAVIETRLVPASRRLPAADTPAFIQHDQMTAIAMQFGSGHQAGHTRADHQHIHRLKHGDLPVHYRPSMSVPIYYAN